MWLANEGDRTPNIGEPTSHLPAIIVESIISTSWHSLTFIGENHRLAIWMPFPHDDATSIIALLASPKWKIPGHIVAEVRIAEVTATSNATGISLVIEMITVGDNGWIPSST